MKQSNCHRRQELLRCRDNGASPRDSRLRLEQPTVFLDARGHFATSAAKFSRESFRSTPCSIIVGVAPEAAR